ncbi:hypothetical protein CPC16_001836 [Podila verticillata]|uniref:Peptidase S1 domain-containing protein n=1 Tax=Podila verticillata NRRL 6337 TaxID=1069443 RepID=A0A086TK08_9FUNG|nr:hypothetical protein BGZ59_010167 [Podila verticillata]KAF9373485.1 hypothetical protein CPC16_001836 [Podila verticillata]KAI9238107.1 MAG: hypothetical protein BYD32DRAFT_436016 [Podila humilis]KFH62285.1 hypothetical protein MVEG_11496 [Podila verticillata NRRL 6337]
MRISAALLVSTALVLLTGSGHHNNLAQAQVSVPGRYAANYAGSPSLALNMFSNPLPVLQLPHLDNAQLLDQEQRLKQLTEEAEGIYQFGHAVEMASSFMDHSTLSAGRWVSLRDLQRVQGQAQVDDDDEIMVWQLEIHSRSALSLNLIFSDFELPDGTEFYVSGKKTLLGAFTAQVNNKADRVFATAPVSGDKILLEYYTPRSILQVAKPRIQLSHVIHGYKPMLLAASSDSTARGFRQRDGSIRPRFPGERHRARNGKRSFVDQSASLSSPSALLDDIFNENDRLDDEDDDSNIPRAMSGKCNVDVACYLKEFHDQSRSVGVILTDYNQKYCTGALVNNVRQDGRQLFLTANHCAGFKDTSSHVVMFNHEKLQCGGSGEVVNEHDTVQGLVLLAGYALSDFTLYEITETIPDAYDLYLAGWSAMSLAPTSRQRIEEGPSHPLYGASRDESLSPWRTPRSKTHNVDDPLPQPPADRDNLLPIVGIHHPSGDSKKISFFFNGSLPKACWSECSPEEYYHWQIPRWDQGTTEPGSSGSPLFDADKRIVGQLHGGSASCWNRNGYDVYGGIHASFQVPPKIKDRLVTYLDPENTGVKVMDGCSLAAARSDSQDRDGESWMKEVEVVEEPLGVADLEKPLSAYGHHHRHEAHPHLSRHHYSREFEKGDMVARARGALASIWQRIHGYGDEAVVMVLEM